MMRMNSCSAGSTAPMISTIRQQQRLPQHNLLPRSHNKQLVRFEGLDRSFFWKLRSGRAVEDVLFAASLDKDATVAIRSCTVDFDCEATKGLFTANEWEELQEHNTFGLPQLPETTVGYILKLRKAMLEGKHVSTVNFPEQDRFSCELAMVTCMKRIPHLL
ncbi:hypothetical protein B0O80DRAFT_152877 [Mortierella sp. GBAus27b]|nr:hypothetical protein B0O80DRAFT_152877 [Mortierella sp. GBAus27b]